MDILTRASDQDRNTRDSPVCLTLYGFIDHQVREVEGRELTLEDLDLVTEVMARRVACPFAAECDRYRRAVERTGNDIYGVYGPPPPVQLEMSF